MVAYFRARKKIKLIQTVIGRGKVQRRKFLNIMHHTIVIQKVTRRRQALLEYKRKRVAGALISRAGRGFQGRTWFKARLGSYSFILNLA
jgi:hypothetical protein